ncbi:MAG TPA: hypothetical protein VMT29_15960 [Steroidobacteraceae bacterium]|nr:hypothetical protein [Steroidobacteraceae bacterium]
MRRSYRVMRAPIPASGVQATVLHIGAETTGMAIGDGSEPQAILVLSIGSSKTARDHSQRVPPAPVELEHAIAPVEDELARARPTLTGRSSLLTTDEAVREIAQLVELAAGTEVGLGKIDSMLIELAPSGRSANKDPAGNVGKPDHALMMHRAGAMPINPDT